MDAKKLFNCLLSNIENSGLNYLVSKTPFSANISLKSSYSKQFSRNDSFQSEPNLLSTCVDQPTKCEEDVVKALKLENLQLKLRAELIKIKNEKSKMSTKIKALESEKSENELLKKEIGDRSKELEEAQRILDSKTSEIKALYKEKDKLTLSLKKLDVDIKEVSLKYQELSTNLYKCTLCDLSVENSANMKTHIREVHSQTKGVQADIFKSSNLNFSEYLCYYCEKPLKSEESLQLHRTKCHLRQLTDFPCLVCGAQCVDKSDLGRHRTTYHRMGSVCKETGNEIFWCDMR